jgi:hypothetical protein
VTDTGAARETRAERQPRELLPYLTVALAAAAAALTVLAATVRYTSFDPSGALLVAEQILANRTADLNAYDPSVLANHWTVTLINGAQNYSLALGSSFGSVPLVAVARVIGYDVAANEARLQIMIAAVLAAATVVLLYALARFFLPHLTSIALATLFWFGTSLASVGGTALWSQDWAVVWGLVALISAIAATERDCRWGWLPLGLALAMAYVTRPTMALLILTLLPYVTWRSRRTGLLTLGTLVVCAVAWVAFSLASFGAALPPYYQVGRLVSNDVLGAFAGLIVSPGRGLLVYTPVLVVIPLLALVRRPRERRQWGLFVVAAAWLLLLVLAVARFPHWYGGWSYGPRLLTEGLPAVFLMLVLAWPPVARSLLARLAIAAFIAAIAWGCYVHTVQGLFNRWTLAWNDEPNVDANSRTLWDWRYPPFLHNEERHAERAELPEYR